MARFQSYLFKGKLFFTVTDLVAVSTATFSEPGDYVLHVIANDWSGEGGRGFVCCWTNAQVKVQVK